MSDWNFDEELGGTFAMDADLKDRVKGESRPA